MATAENVYCYHCGRHHPRKEMRQIETKSGKKWRCIQSIEATKKNRTQRDAFGKTVTAINTSENQARIKSRLHAARLVTGQWGRLVSSECCSDLNDSPRPIAQRGSLGAPKRSVVTESFVPIGDSGGSWKRTLAGNPRKWKAAVRYAKEILLAQRLLCSGSGRSNLMTWRRSRHNAIREMPPPEGPLLCPLQPLRQASGSAWGAIRQAFLQIASYAGFPIPVR